ncbi:hypothetical protein [Rhizobium sp. BK650]|uniref:hypothetical protein n=1 Tax=Rhizobium sp. BK650 TaxID=2586990 RepID=UPI0039185F77
MDEDRLQVLDELEDVDHKTSFRGTVEVTSVGEGQPSTVIGCTKTEKWRSASLRLSCGLSGKAIRAVALRYGIIGCVSGHAREIVVAASSVSFSFFSKDMR